MSQEITVKLKSVLKQTFTTLKAWGFFKAQVTNKYEISKTKF